MKKNNDKNKAKDNMNSDKKTIVIFVILMICCLFVGYLVGAGAANLQKSKTLMDILRETGNHVLQAAPVIFIVVNIAACIISAGIMIKCEKRFKKWDGEDEDEIESIESVLDFPMILTSIVTILNFFMFSVMLYITEFTTFGREHKYFMFFYTLIVFEAGMIWSTYIQKKCVDLIKKINPEKKGNVLDPSFIKQWENSCDEAELLMIYKAGYGSFRAVEGACAFLWIVTLVCEIAFNTGIFPCVILTVLWLTSVIAYSVESRRLERKK